ncbi:unnamed protein product [Clonostachys rhizophaga]|uniref:Uncharacterized protein n=1 Tax=Clonostachys rhizophaga TaxID=160324 RepID=A0A9N9VK75_9HYPO|nr:unnamed protein product [Clonostachys rhizophaga]
MRLSYIQTAIILSLSGLQQAAGAPIGRYSIQRRDEYGTSSAAYYIDERTPQVASIKARADKDQKQNQLSNKPSSGTPSNDKPPASAAKPASPATKPAPPAAKPAPPAAKPASPAAKPASPAAKPASPAGKPIAPAAKPAGGQSAESSSTRPDYGTKPLNFNPFNSQDPDYPYTLKQPEHNPTADYDGTLYQMWDITKKVGPENTKPQCVDQFGFAHDGKNLVIKSAMNHADLPIKGKKATLAELLMATYKYAPKGGFDSANLQAIRIQDVEEKATADLLAEIDKAMNPELQKPAKDVVTRPEGMSKAIWNLKKNKLRNEANRRVAKEAASQERPPRITKFDFSDTSNPKLYQDLKNSEWGKSVQRICDKFTKRIVRIHVNMAETQSYIIFYLG